VIAVIESAIVNGQAQPWMYDVLALSMEIAGRPKAEIERVLLSRVDFMPADTASVLYSAAYLTRFGAHAQALRLYRQASQMEPTRPEPYVLGLKLARQQKDYDAVQWAVTGILSSSWTGDRQDLYRQAEDAALETRQELIKAGRTEEADEFQAAIDEARKRDLVIRLDWTGEGDLDLIVEEPPGTICSFENRYSPGGGVLVHDGHGPDPKNCYEKYVCAFGVSGDYRVRIRHVWGNIVGRRARLTVVRYQGTSDETVQTFTVPLDKREKVVRITLENGRRTELAPVPRREATEIGRPHRTRRGLPRMVEGFDPPARRRFEQSRQRAEGIRRGPGGEVGFQPVVTVLGDGVSLLGRAVVSGDRRYVRIDVGPTFQELVDVFTFTMPAGGTTVPPFGGGFGPGIGAGAGLGGAN
jgi:hypothetical protein